MKSVKTLLLALLISLSFHTMAQSTIYTNDMDYVLGDAKQACIQNKLTTTTKVEALLAGFKKMQVNGIRVPIFPTGENPNEPMMAYLIQRATEEGFNIFANPAQGGGGARIANEDLGNSSNTKGDSVKTQILISRILEFDKKYPCKWINPFNEDSRPNTMWTVEQINTIYSTLKDSLVNAELIGPCVWGIPASILVLEQTKIRDYVTVSTTHNLGFNHSSWTKFINLSRAAGLPVWDSEVNHNKKYENKSTRLEAAIKYGVDGLVLYDSWNNINLTTSAVNNGGLNMMALYLKPTTLSTTKTVVKYADVYQENYGFRVEFLTMGQNYSVNILDITGKTIQQHSHILDSELEVRNLRHGLYLVVIKANNQVQVEKIMVN